MSINRSKIWLVLGLQIALAAVAEAQELPDYEWVPGVRDFQPFAPASDITSPYGSGSNRRKRGWFFTIEDIAWSTSAPQRTTVGKEGYNPIVSTGTVGGFIVQPNTLDTGFIQPRLENGERIQLGYVGDDNIGWLVGTFVLHSQGSTTAVSNAGVSFGAPFVNGVSPLEGFLEESLTIPPNQPPPFGTGGTGGGGGGTGSGGTAIVDADINNNHVFGGSGRDIGTPNTTPPPSFTPPPDGFPDVPAPTDFGDLVNLPIFFDHVYTNYSSRVWGIEVMRTYGLSKSRRADHGVWDFMAGVRYIRFRDQFYFLGEGFTQQLSSGTGGGGGTGGSGGGAVIQSGLLSDTHFTQTSSNNLVGPQIGLRYQKQRGRLAFNTEWRFMAAGNAQNNLQQGAIGEHAESGSLRPVLFVQFPQASSAFLSQQAGTGTGTGTTSTSRAFTAPQFRAPNFVPQGVYHTQHIATFAPVGEFRFDLKYQIFRQCYATVGWTGLVMGGIGRSPNMVNYSLPDLGILNTGGNRQVVFLQGINFGFTINR